MRTSRRVDRVGKQAVWATDADTSRARYIASWLDVLRSDKRAIFTAASKAQQIADWMHAQQDNVHQHDNRGAA